MLMCLFVYHVLFSSHYRFNFDYVGKYIFSFKTFQYLLRGTSPCSGYIGEFEIIDDHRACKIVVHLNGRLNKVNFCNIYLIDCENSNFELLHKLCHMASAAVV